MAIVITNNKSHTSTEGQQASDVAQATLTHRPEGMRRDTSMSSLGFAGEPGARAAQASMALFTPPEAKHEERKPTDANHGQERKTTAAKHEKEHKSPAYLDDSLAIRGSKIKDAHAEVVKPEEGLHGKRSVAVGQIQERLLEVNRDGVLNAVRERYLGKSAHCQTEEDVLRIAQDGRRGEATDAAIAATRVKLGMSAQGGASKEFLQRLWKTSAEELAKHDAKDKEKDKDKPLATRLSERTLEGAVDLASQEVARMIDKGKSPMAALQALRDTHGVASLGLVDMRLRANYEREHDVRVGEGRSLVEQLAQERKIPASEVAGVATLMYPGRYQEAAAAEAVMIYRYAKGHTSGGERKLLDRIISENNGQTGDMKPVAEVFSNLLGGEWDNKYEKKHGPVKDPVKFFRFVMEHKRIMKSDEMNQHGLTE